MGCADADRAVSVYSAGFAVRAGGAKIDARPGRGVAEDARHGADLYELVGNIYQLVGCAYTEADDLAAHAFLLDCLDQAHEVAVAAHEHDHVEVLGKEHDIYGYLDVEVGLDASALVLVDIFADGLVAVGAQEVYEFALVGIVGVNACVSGGAYQVASCNGVLQEAAIVHLHAGGLRRIEEIRDVHEDAYIVCHMFVLRCVAFTMSVLSPSGAHI